MTNQSIIRVVIFGALAIIGIIAIQAYLLINTWDEKEQEFEEKVVIALQRVAEQFEKMGSTVQGGAGKFAAHKEKMKDADAQKKQHDESLQQSREADLRQSLNQQRQQQALDDINRKI